MKGITEQKLQEWSASLPLIADIMAMQETLWLNDQLLPFDQAIKTSVLSTADVHR